MSARQATVGLDRAFAALAHPVRRRILESTLQRGRGVTDLTRDFDITLAAVSRHVRVLERAGLVHRRIVGRDHVISARLDELRAARQWMDRQTAFWEQAMAKLKREMEGPR